VGIPEELDLLDSQIQRLQIEWDKFFGGAERKPPHELIRRVEGLIRKHAYAEIRNNADRFRYQSLTSRYNSLNELWNKKMRAREEGQAFGIHGPHHVQAAESIAAPSQRTPNPPAQREVRIIHANQDPQSVQTLFEQFVAARRAAGESATVKLESFQKLIQQQTTRIMSEKGARAVNFRIETRDGKVTLKAKPVA
jgi:hypothetical protein